MLNFLKKLFQNPTSDSHQHGGGACCGPKNTQAHPATQATDEKKSNSPSAGNVK